MTYTLKLHGVIVGRSDLEDRDPAARVAHGHFRPGVGYELVEPIFAQRGSDSDAARYRESRKVLHLELFDANGMRVTMSGVDIEGAGSSRSELRLRVGVTDARFWSTA